MRMGQTLHKGEVAADEGRSGNAPHVSRHRDLEAAACGAARAGSYIHVDSGKICTPPVRVSVRPRYQGPGLHKQSNG